MKILIVEFYTWHDECIYTTCKLLKQNGAEVYLVLNEDIRKRTEVILKDTIDGIKYYPFKRGVKGIFALIRLYWYALNNGFTHLYFNTASGSETWKFLILPIPKRIKVVGTMHNIQKLSKSFGQRIITRQIDGYILLSDILKSRYKNLCKKAFEVIYPIIYPTISIANIEKPKGEIWIGIPGAVSYSRRDYLSLLSAINSKTVYNKRVKFVLLGNIHRADGDHIYEKICDSGLEDSFIVFEGYVPDEKFYGYISKCDYLMPLIHPSKKEYSKYLSDKISGTYNLAFAYKIPMLCPTEMMEYDDFVDTSLFYPLESLVDFINHLQPSDKDMYFKNSKWDINIQAKRLANFMDNI